MANNEEPNGNIENKSKIAQEINEAKETATEAVKLAASVSSGNVAETIKSAAKLAKSKMAKKNIKKQLIMSCAWIIELSSKLVGAVKSFWNWLTNDYWIKLDEDIEYVDSNTRPAEEG